MSRLSWTLLCLAALGCDGRYRVGRELAAQDQPSYGGAPAVDGVAPSAGSMAVGGSSAVPPDSPSGGGVPSLTLTTLVETGCGVPPEPPEPLTEPIRNHMTWWYRLEHLIWGEIHEPPVTLPAELSHEQAGEIVELAIDQAIAETGGIPGALPFVRTLLGVPDGEQLSVPWASLLVHGPMLDVLLQQPHDQGRVGVFTEPLFLTTFPGISQRGNRIHEALLNQSIPPKPEGIPTLIEAPAGSTRRQRMELALEQPNCAGCHQVVDPPGFSLEDYDELGQPRTLDRDKPVETHGVFTFMYVPGSIDFQDHSDLVSQLASSCVVNLSFADRFLRYALEATRSAVDINADYSNDSARMRQAFLSGGRSYRSLVKELAQGPTLRSM